MARYAYHLYVEGELKATFTSINKLLNSTNLPFPKQLEIGKFYRQDYFDKNAMKTYIDDELKIRIEVKHLV